MGEKPGKPYIHFLGPRQWPPALESPVLSGQKRNFRERYVETHPTRPRHSQHHS